MFQDGGSIIFGFQIIYFQCSVPVFHGAPKNSISGFFFLSILHPQVIVWNQENDISAIDLFCLLVMLHITDKLELPVGGINAQLVDC